jgi:undecaprenyl-diphosphatase
VQGVTEVVPVSSSAHLALLPRVLGWDEPAERTALAAGLHAGSCLGIAWALRREVRDALRDPCEVAMLAVACVPAAVAGLMVDRLVEERLGGTPQLAACVALAGIALWAADQRPQDGGLGPRQAVVAGLAQTAALAPGVSRAGATLTALRLLRVDRAEAARFSLLLSLPVTGGAAALSLARSDRRALAGPLAAGAPVAALAGAAAATAWRRRPAQSATAPAVYRLVLAAAVAARSRQARRPV